MRSTIGFLLKKTMSAFLHVMLAHIYHFATEECLLCSIYPTFVLYTSYCTVIVAKLKHFRMVGKKALARFEVLTEVLTSIQVRPVGWMSGSRHFTPSHPISP